MVKEKTNQDILKALLAPEKEVRETIFMKRFGFDFVLRSLSDEDMKLIRERATRHLPKGKTKFDDDLFNYLSITKACVVPNWEDPELIAALDAIDSVDAVKKRLLVGEVTTLVQKIAEVNGFDVTEDEEIEEAKN